MQVLVLQTSLRGADSASRALVDTYLNTLQAHHRDVTITVRDLASQPIPHLPAALIPVQLGLSEGADESAALAEELIVELERADIVVIGVAFYNFMISSSLKAWSDYVVRVRRTFVYGAEGPIGLLPAGKKVIAFMASGGVYSAGPAAAMDLAIPYLRTIFGFIGITDVEVVRAEAQADPTAGPVALDRALEAARLFA
ncbi:FMN-dependent NADH-azoreductase [Sphingomonas abietis]|uniref:FMN dependent NADH:quinone oxidoreductase n=1 Tax=Sphingomonas abietis TaxID=3012344 RepID=A0ABY7NS82_9SPHN|nr:NAD(P)H-dependent oxidoreductase [Sphingomonas abietis]WBO23311.1 NAD(P)H-dependent oxidoreductase [Sphingomonas abietis]